jgi:hypothetical protein
MTVTPDSATPPAADAVKIGLWGPPGSGKTTYLAALPFAIRADNPLLGKWNIFPRSAPAKDLYVRFMHALEVDRRFPETTVPGAVVPLEWEFAGYPAQSKAQRRRQGLRRRPQPVSRFLLDLVDVHGGAYSHDPAQADVNPEVTITALDHLAAAQGIIYLFDPIGEKKNRNSHTYMTSTIPELMLRAAEAGLAEPYLRHHVSVCITKFDDKELFHQARLAHLVTKGPDGMPRVLDRHAEQFFDELCTGAFWNERYEEGQHSALAVRAELRRLFRPECIRYFVTSSIGFRMAPPAPGESAFCFDEEDFGNCHDVDGRPKIRDAVRPINVLEPLISLQQRISGQG